MPRDAAGKFKVTGKKSISISTTITVFKLVQDGQTCGGFFLKLKVHYRFWEVFRLSVLRDRVPDFETVPKKLGQLESLH